MLGKMGLIEIHDNKLEKAELCTSRRNGAGENFEAAGEELINETSTAEVHAPISVRRLARIPRPSTRLQDFSTFHTIQHPIQDFVGYDKVSYSYLSFLYAIEE